MARATNGEATAGASATDNVLTGECEEISLTDEGGTGRLHVNVRNRDANESIHGVNEFYEFKDGETKSFFATPDNRISSIIVRGDGSNDASYSMTVTKA